MFNKLYVFLILFSVGLASLPCSAREAKFYQKLPGGDVQCGMCPRECLLKEGQTGVCTVRKNVGGILKSLVYAKPCSVNIDPVEKKPLYHFLPGTPTLSLATAGCNLRCIFCQNWNISQAEPSAVESVDMSPAQAAELAKSKQCPSISFTYSEPTVFYEYMFDTGLEAHSRKIRNVMITSGFINQKPLESLCDVIDAANVDLKGFSDEAYRRMAAARLGPVLETLKTMKRRGVWLEVGMLVIPTINDSTQELTAFSDWIVKNLGPDVPVHFLRFFPQHKLTSLPPTPVEKLEEAQNIAKRAGIHYVYVGNVPDGNGNNTYCHKCGKLIIERKGYFLGKVNMKDGHCAFCGQKIPGVWK